ncbi:MAG: hypothetical protein ACXAAI_16280, partial [Promethearchaeota archaeon]
KNFAEIISQFTDSIGLDTVDPTGFIEVNGGDVWTNTTNVDLTLTYNDATSGVAEVRYSNDGSSWTAWEAALGTKAWTLSTGDSDSKTVYYEIKDFAGRISQFTDTIGLDTANPTGSVIINSDALWSTSTSVDLALTYNDITSGVLEVRYSNDGISWTNWESPSTTKAWTLSSGDGTPKTVFFQIKDNAQRISTFSDNIGLDTVDPTGSIEVNGGDVWTNTTNVDLTLTYIDATSGVLEVRYSNDGSSWTGWEAAVGTKAWTLFTGDSDSKTVYYEIKDYAGRISQLTDAIGLDTVNPSGSIDINGGDAWTNSTDVLLYLTFDDVISGVYQVRYRNDGSSWTGWQAAVGTKTWTLSTGDGDSDKYYKCGIIFDL